MKPMYAVAATGVTLVLLGLAYLISGDSLVWVAKALPMRMGHDLSNGFSLFLDHKVPVMVTAALLVVIDFVRKVPVIRSR